MRAIRWLLWPAALALGGAIGHDLHRPATLHPRSMPAHTQRVPDAVLLTRTHRSKLRHKLLSCDPVQQDQTLLRVQSAVTAAIDRRVATGDLLHGSAYIHDLNGGRWTEAYGDIAYSPASINKVVWMIAALAHDQAEPGFVDQPFAYPGRLDPTELQTVVPKFRLKRGSTYPLARVIEASIVESDNDAMRVVQDSVDRDESRAVFNDLGMREITGFSPSLNTDYDRIRPRDIAHLFRALYDASYLNPARSERALGWLANVDFTAGLRAAAPPSVRVAHKFGEFWSSARYGANFQFHDCGIVYFPGRPHVICLMTRGPDYDRLRVTVDDLARVAYNAISHDLARTHR